MPTPKTKKNKTAPAPDTREVLHQFALQAHREVNDTGLTADGARQLLGWSEEPEGIKFGADYTFKTPKWDEDRNRYTLSGTKVRTLFNNHNRPFDDNLSLGYMQEMLRRRWRLNGENIIIGKYGQVISGQHRLAALVFASIVWNADRQAYRGTWDSEPVLDCTVVYGIEETDDVVNTIDTARPRGLDDVLFRSEHLASVKKPADRKEIARIAAWAVKYLWHRTGAFLDAFAPRRTHAESMDFIERHPTLLKCVKHVHEENKTSEDKSRIGRYVSPGCAAALLYLMAVGGSSEEQVKDYEEGGRKESALGLSLFDKAMDFWMLLAAGAPESKALRYKLGGLGDEDGTLGGTRDEKVAVVIKAWRLYLAGTPATDQSQLNLVYLTNEEGVRKLIERNATLGGIDLGNPKPRERDEDDEVTEETVAERQAEVDAENLRRQRERDKPVEVRTPPSRRVAEDHGYTPGTTDPAPTDDAPAPAVDPATGFKARPKKAKDSLQAQREAEARALDAAGKGEEPTPPPAKVKKPKKVKEGAGS